MQRAIIILSTILLVAGLSCTQPPNFPNEPVITYLGANQTQIAQGNNASLPDTLIFRIGFTDGDGDLGNNEGTVDIFLTDSRDGVASQFRLPFIPDEGVGNGIEGVLTLRFPNRPSLICCIPPAGLTPCVAYPEYPTDSFFYTISIKDRAGNMSNEITTEEITILCN